MSKIRTYFKNNIFNIISWFVTIVLVAGIFGGAFAWKQSTTVVQAAVPEPTKAPGKEQPQVEMPALGGGPEAFVSIGRDETKARPELCADPSTRGSFFG